MSKPVQMIVEIDKNGKLYVEADGTSGNECVDLLKFLDFVNGLTVVDSGRVEDTKPQKVHTDVKQNIKQ